MFDDPTPFREALREYALAKRWADWDVTRLVFADWLADHNLVEEHAARAYWKLVWSKRRTYQFRVAGPRTTLLLSSQRPKLVRRLNARPLLGFFPGSLRLLHFTRPRDGSCFLYDFSWCPLRSLTTLANGEPFPDRGSADYRWLDAGLPNFGEGFAALWVPRGVPQQRYLFGEGP